MKDVTLRDFLFKQIDYMMTVESREVPAEGRRGTHVEVSLSGFNVMLLLVSVSLLSLMWLLSYNVRLFLLYFSCVPLILVHPYLLNLAVPFYFHAETTH